MKLAIFFIALIIMTVHGASYPTSSRSIKSVTIWSNTLQYNTATNYKTINDLTITTWSYDYYESEWQDQKGGTGSSESIKSEYLTMYGSGQYA